MKRQVKAVIAGRFLLPLALLIGCCIRINVMSLLYFVLLLALPFIPVPTIERVTWLTIKYTQCVIGTSLSSSLAQLIFHISLLASQPYGRDFIDCEPHEKIARQFGFQRWDTASSHQIVRLIAPELLIVFASVFTYRMYKKRSSGGQKFTLSAGLFSTATFSFNYGEKHLRDEKSSISPTSPTTAAGVAGDSNFPLHQHGQHHANLVKIAAPAKTLSDHFLRTLKQLRRSPFWIECKRGALAVFVCLAAIAHPSLISLIYFGIFLVLANLWLLNIRISPRNRSRLIKFLAVMSGAHLFLLYFYQFDFVQDFLDRHSVVARLLGFTTIYETNCADVRSLNLNPDYRASYVLNFLALALLYRSCIKTICDEHRNSFQLVVRETEERLPKGALIQAEIRNSKLIRRSISPESKAEWFRKIFRRPPKVKFPQQTDQFRREIRGENVVDDESNETDDDEENSELLFAASSTVQKFEIEDASSSSSPTSPISPNSTDKSSNIVTLEPGSSSSATKQSRKSPILRVVDHDGKSSPLVVEMNNETSRNLSAIIENSSVVDDEEEPSRTTTARTADGNFVDVQITDEQTDQISSSIYPSESINKPPEYPTSDQRSAVIEQQHSSTVDRPTPNSPTAVPDKPMFEKLNFRALRGYNDDDEDKIDHDHQIPTGAKKSRLNSAQFRRLIGSPRAMSIFELKKRLSVSVEWTKKLKRLVGQYSYVGCLVIMMTWSITYHSWMTFAMLLLACGIWMVPNPRQFCLRITPYLVVYAEMLLVFQYIYGFELSEGELPSETIPVLHQIGFVKPNLYPAWVHLCVKLCYTFVFWLAFKSYIRDRQRRSLDDINQAAHKGDGDIEAGNAALASDRSVPSIVRIEEVEEAVAIESPGIKPLDDAEIEKHATPRASVEHVSRRARYISTVTQLAQHKNLVSKFVQWVHGKVTQLWIVVCCVVLLFISLRQPVVAYRIIYMGLLLIFINCFLISFQLWRKLLHYFWTVMIVYCMFVLTFIYTYQFRKFPEMWHEGTGWSYDVLESLGLEQYSNAELLMKLLTPISFLICTIVQLKFFHKRLIEKTEKLERALEEAEKRPFTRINSVKIEKRASTASIAELDEPDEPPALSIGTDQSIKKDQHHADQESITSPSIKEAEKGDAKVTSDKDKDKPNRIEVDLAQLLKSGFKQLWSFIRTHRVQIIELVWRIFEMHISKVVAFQMIVISIREVSAIHLPYPIFVAIMLPRESSAHLVCKLAGVWTSIIIFVKMIFQMKFVRPADGYVNCSAVPDAHNAIYRPLFPFPDSRTVDPSAWAGFEKTDHINAYLRPYLLLIGLLILQEFVRMRQSLHRSIKSAPWPHHGVLFENITRREADDNFLSCLMYFVNFFFYKFGMEICFMTSVATIGLRCDFVSLLYAIWFMVLLVQRRKRLARIWRFYLIFLAVLLPLQYLACVGIPPSICSSYPWSFINQNMLEWLYIPDFAVPPNAMKLGADFVQLVFACCQSHVFEIETSSEAYSYPGGDNSELVVPLPVVSFRHGFKAASESCQSIEDANAMARKSEFEEPVTDFISYPKSYLDLLKIVIFEHLYWCTLTLVFVAGVSRVTLFAMGYVVAGFLFLWVGNELFLKPLSFGLRLWDTLIFYNALVIIIKTTLQVIGCVFLDDLYKNYCWGLQLFGIACLRSGFDPAKVFDDKILADCKVPTTEAGIIFDGVCFCFLLLQRRIITSRYFTHVVTEFRAQHVFANRGAELIHKIRAKEIWEQHGRERELVSKIKQKMEKIKEAQARMSMSAAGDQASEAGGPKEPGGRHGGERSIASLDIDDDANDAAWDLDLQDEKHMVPENEEDRRKGLGPLQLLNVAFKKGDIKAAVEDAKQMEAQEAELEKRMTDRFGKADKKAIKKALLKRGSTKVLPDFEEETFDTEPIATDVVGEDYARKFDVNASQDEESQSYEHSDDVHSDDDIGTPVEETPPESRASPSPERDQKVTALLAQTFVVKKLIVLWTAVVEFLNNTITFLKLFLNGVLESTIAWLLKISREYRYVAHVLTEEKNSFKSQKKLSNLNRGPSLLTISSARKLGGYRRGSGGPEKRKKTRGLSFYDRKLAEEEALKFNKDRNLIVRLLTSTYYVLLSRSELFCYLMMVLAHMASAGFVTMPLPIMAFVWGTLSVPKPTKRFWIAVITYCEAIVIMKYLFQFGFFPWNKGEPPPSPFFAPRILGLERKDKYAAWDLALLMMLFFHRSNLKTLGLWKERQDTDADSMSSQQSSTRGGTGGSRVSSIASITFGRKGIQVVVPPSIPEETRQNGDGEEAGGEEGQDEAAAAGNPNSKIRKLRKQYRKMKNKWKKVKIQKWLKKQGTMMFNFFKTLVNPRFRCSIDVYALMFLCDFICFAIVIFGYWAFGTETAAGGIASYFEENKIPGPFLAMLVVQFVLIIIDRALFLRKHLLGKVVYQIGLVFFIHVWMFFILPAVTERQFINNTPAKLWYFVKCIYFCLSAWQIRSGYPTRVLGNMLTKKYNYLNMFLFKGFMTIPFLFELRALMDWIWTDTSMSLSDWLKLEDIYANIYQIKCERQIEEDYPTPRGVKKRPMLKYGWGGFLLFIMILIIWFPLVLFSLANTVGVRSPPVDVTVRLTLGTYPPLFQVRTPEQARSPLTDEEFEQLQYDYRYSKMATAYMSDYSSSDTVRVTVNSYSETVWSISPPARQHLIMDLNSTNTIALKFEWNFARSPDGSTQSNVVSDENIINLIPGDRVRTKLINMLINGSMESEEANSVEIPRLYPAYVKVPGKGKAGPVQALLSERAKGDLKQAFTNTTLHLVRPSIDHSTNMSNGEYWRLTSHESMDESNGGESFRSLEYLRMIGFVDKVFPATFNLIAGGGILGLYATLVLVVGKFIRGMVTGAMSRIMFEELPNVDRILQLCLDIFLVREAGELALEEDLFAKLIFIYRSPATLIKWTKLKRT